MAASLARSASHSGNGKGLASWAISPAGEQAGKPAFAMAVPNDVAAARKLLAEAGYAVLRINFRGSGNYGQRFRQAGARQWGGAMQDDLTDATRWAIEQRIAGNIDDDSVYLLVDQDMKRLAGNLTPTAVGVQV